MCNIFQVAFVKYNERCPDEQAEKMANLTKYGTYNTKHIWMLRYGMSFEDIELLEDYIESIDERGIIVMQEFSNLPQKVTIAIVFALGFTGNMVQANSISDAFHNAFGLPKLAVGLVTAAVAAFIFLGGVRRIASFTEKVVPIMALFYIIGCTALLVINHEAVPEALRMIFTSAFSTQAVVGGAAGISVQQAMRIGVARGLFSNEAGMGSTPHAHALAKVKHPQEQGEIAMVSVFIDTFVILTLTAMVILTSGVLGSGATGAALAQLAFSQKFGWFGDAFIAMCMLFFAFSTIIGWYFFGEINFKALFGKKALPVYSIGVVLCVLFGSLQEVELVWNLSDLFNGLMVIPNLIALLALSGLVVKISRENWEEEDEKSAEEQFVPVQSAGME